MVELVTEQGWHFFSSAEVAIGGKTYDMDELTDGQRRFVAGKLHEQAMNAAFAGELEFKAKDIPRFKDVFT